MAWRWRNYQGHSGDVPDQPDHPDHHDDTTILTQAGGYDLAGDQGQDVERQNRSAGTCCRQNWGYSVILKLLSILYGPMIFICSCIYIDIRALHFKLQND